MNSRKIILKQNFFSLTSVPDLDEYIFSLLSSKNRSEVCSVSKFFLKLSIAVSKSLSKRPELYDICYCTFAGKNNFNKMVIQKLNNYLTKNGVATPKKGSGSGKNGNILKKDLIKLAEIHTLKNMVEPVDIRKVLSGCDYHLLVRLKPKYHLNMNSVFKQKYKFTFSHKNENLEDVITLLTEKGVRCFSNDYYIVCENGNLNALKLIIEKNLIYCDQLTWGMGLRSACINYYPSTTEKIIDLIMFRGVGQKSIDKALYEACDSGNLEITKLMIAKGATDWREALDGAISGGNFDIIKLIALEIKDDDQDYWCRNLENYCHSTNLNVEIINFMIGKGANNLDMCLSAVCSLPKILDSKFTNTKQEIHDFMVNKGANSCDWCDWDIRSGHPHNL